MKMTYGKVKGSQHSGKDSCLGEKVRNPDFNHLNT